MVVAGIVIGGLGIVAALALGVAAKVFYVEIDPLVMEIEEALPGANCGGCGQPGCSGAAVAISQGLMPPNACVAGGAEVAVKVAAIMGMEVKETEPEIAQVGCRYPIQRADMKYNYDGVTDCRAAYLLYDGPKECPVGCIGLGSCVKACPFDALTIGPDNLPVVDEEKCTGCGTCVRTCPAGIMKLTSVSDRILGEYTWDECTAPCQRRCPAGINIPEQILYTAKGDYDRALKIIKERNPLPLICGRICPNPCEVACRRNLEDEPVAINYLKRFVADRERSNGQRQQLFKAPATDRKVAVIGGGVEGLTTANFLARLGHTAALFEARPQLGGLLRTAIPESRLPRDILDWEIQGILDLGVEAQTSKAFGRDFGLADLFDQGYEVVMLATGGWDALLVPGQDTTPAPALPGVYLLLPLTMALASGQEVPLGERAAVVGEGREALSAAKQCLKRGVKEVTILSAVPLDNWGISGLEAIPEKMEGITVQARARVTGITGQGDKMTGLTYSIAGFGEHHLKVDSIIAASGRLPDMLIAPIPVAKPVDVEKTEEVEDAPRIPGSEVKWQSIMPYRPDGKPIDMFHAYDPVSDHRAAVEAIGAGRRAAASIHHFLNNDEFPELEVDIVHDPARLDVDSLSNLLVVGPRNIMPEATPEERLDPMREIALGYDEEKAKAEAARCLNCGLICYYRTQYH